MNSSGRYSYARFWNAIGTSSALGASSLTVALLKKSKIPSDCDLELN